MKEYNLFTQKLFRQGYTFELFPDYAKLPNSYCSRELFDILGGFEYTRAYLNSKVYSTGCGLLCQGNEFTNGYLSYGGIDWKPENDNPVIQCPYRAGHCSLRHPVLEHLNGGGLVKFSHCNCREVSKPYTYEESLRRVRDGQSRIRREKYEAFRLQKQGHICPNHCHYDEWKGIWKQHYDPMECVKTCVHIGGTCELTHMPISPKKGNIFYDMKITRVRNDHTLFHGQEEITIQKGCRLLKTNTSITLCENILRYGKHGIFRKEKDMQSWESLIDGKKIEILNVRIEQRESRDLLEDLRDIQEGIQVVHASDQKKAAKEAKRQRKQERLKRRERKLKKKIVEQGWENIPPHSLDYNHALKWFDANDFDELRKQREEYLADKENEPHQLSLFGKNPDSDTHA